MIDTVSAMIFRSRRKKQELNIFYRRVYIFGTETDFSKVTFLCSSLIWIYWISFKGICSGIIICGYFNFENVIVSRNYMEVINFGKYIYIYIFERI